MKLDIPEGREFSLSPSVLGGIIALVLVITGIFTSVYQVNPDEQAVVLRFGRMVDIKSMGLHFKLPYGIDHVEKVAALRLDMQEFGYRERQPNRDITEENLMLTGDLNLVRAGWNVQYTRTDPESYLFNVRDPEVTLWDISQSVMREVMGDNASILILTTARGQIQQQVRDLIQQYCDSFQMGIHINEVNLMFVEPPNQVRSAFDDLNKAEQDAVRFFEEASSEYQSRIPQARGLAERIILEAQGFRQERINSALGEAKRFDAMLQQYRSSPEVTRYRLYLETLEKQFPNLKEIVVVDEELKSVLPLLNLREK